MSNDTCTAEDCANEGKLTGMCRKHYYKNWRATQDTARYEATEVEARFWPMVVKGPDCWGWTGSKLRGYGKLGVRGQTAYAHRVSYELAHGPIPDGLVIDHLCHNPTCTNPDHLRAVTQKQNNENRAGANPGSVSGVRGVHWRKDCKKWQATARSGGKIYHLGYFDDLAEAAVAAIKKRNELFTHNDLDRKAA